MKDHIFILTYLERWNKHTFTILQCLTEHMSVREIFRNIPIHRKGIVSGHKNRSWKSKAIFMSSQNKLMALPPRGKIFHLFPSQVLSSCRATSPIHAVLSAPCNQI